MADNRIEIIIHADGTKAVKSLNDVGGSMKRFKADAEGVGSDVKALGGSIESAVSPFQMLTRSIAVTTAAMAGMKLVHIGMDFENSIFQMSETFQDRTESMVEQARSMTERIRHYYNFDEVAYAFTKTADSMERYGITGERYLALVERAVDVGAAKNLELKESIDRIESAMRGEAEASEYLGVTLNDTYMKNMAFGGTLKDIWEKLDDNTKAFYRFNEMMLQTGKYSGAAERATGTLSGSLKSLANTLMDDVGPAMTVVNGILTTYVNLANSYLQDSPLQRSIKSMQGELDAMRESSKGGLVNWLVFGPSSEDAISRTEELLSRARRAQSWIDVRAMRRDVTMDAAQGPPGGNKLLNESKDIERALESTSPRFKYDQSMKQATDWLAQGKITQAQFDTMQAYYKKQMDSALKSLAGGGGASPLGLEDMNQKIDQFQKKVRSMSDDLVQDNYDLWAQMAENSGEFYRADELRIGKWYDGVIGKIGEETTDAKNRLRELDELSVSKRGVSPQALSAITMEKAHLEQVLAIEEERKQVAWSMAEAKRRALEIAKLGDVQTARQLNVEYMQLTGSMRDQYNAQVLLVRATLDRNLAEARTPEIADYYRKIADEQERMYRLQGSGSWWDGVIEGANKAGRELPTAFDRGIQAIDAWKQGIGTLSDTLADFCTTGEIDFSSMANSIIRDLIRMELQAELTELSFGKNGLMSLLMSAFGNGGGSSSPTTGSFGVESFAGIGGGYAKGGVVSLLNPERFATGGIVSRPSLAWVGEGRHREAIVPLPDGRSIPARVTDSEPSRPMSVTVNIDNQSSTPVQATQTYRQRDAHNAVVDMVLTDILEMGPLWHQIRGKK